MIRALLSIVDDGRRPRVVAQLLVAVVYGALSGAAMALLVPLARALVDDPPAATGWLVALAVLVAVAAALHFFQALAMNAMALEVVGGMHERAADALVDVPLSWCTRERAASVSDALITGTTAVGMSVAHLLSPVVSTFSGGIVLVIAVGALDVSLAAALLAGALILWWMNRWAGKVVERGERDVHARRIAVQGAVVDFARHQAVLRASGVDAASYAPIAGALDDERVTNRRVGAKTTVASMLGGAGVQAVLSAVIVMAVYGGIGGATDAATTLAVIALAARFTGPLTELAGLSSALRVTATRIGRISEITGAPSLPRPVEGAEPDGAGTVVFKDVVFGYEGEGPVLNGLSFSVAPGEVVGLIGPSGCGKSTVLKLIARFMDVGSGSVTVSGHDVREYRATDLMGQLSVVFQDVHLFDGTLWDNIAVGRPDAGRDEILAAARAAGVGEIAARHDDGFDLRVGEGGKRLSGGERQRISLARALLKDAPIVLLDEATSSLDAHNEHYVLRGIGELARTRTVIMVAHRPSALRHCDRFIVLGPDGSVEATGDEATLVEVSDTYRSFREAGNAAAAWEL
ncbi:MULTISPECIES: ABC transporter ATP-binding protein [Corynebacterium]|uniref:ABC transporter ATP-binding protein n=1 Tax=Corynebacterium TaxID=1716 RepID=UPI0008A1C8B1|nr:MULTISPECIES: ABC transporter ATP-binding protein [Corynebacterium]MCG7438416.1 ABC transporter ATP-binding protein/permease [Corynebacterium freneyi]OFU52799.1 hypothetical protein HMPREF3121_10435 [Corynebacterium sp. HMSC11E11]